MKKIKNAAKRTKYVEAQHGYFRRFVRRVLLSWLKRQDGGHQKEMEKIFEKLEDLETSIELIAGQVAKRARRND